MLTIDWWLLCELSSSPLFSPVEVGGGENYHAPMPAESGSRASFHAWFSSDCAQSSIHRTEGASHAGMKLPSRPQPSEQVPEGSSAASPSQFDGIVDGLEAELGYRKRTKS